MVATPDEAVVRDLPSAVFWDMDGTLLDTEKIWDVSLSDLAVWLGGELTDEVRESMVGSNQRSTLRTIFDHLDIEPSAERLAEADRYLTERTAELFSGALPWRPGAYDTLTGLATEGVPMALVTSTTRELTELALHTIGRSVFQETVCGDEVDGKNKPHPEPYARAARLLGVDASNCIAVEDSPTGVRSAVAAGCTVLAVPCEVPVPEGERRVLRDSLAGVDLALLRGLLLDPGA
ncbi:HAD superfamily hydrolase (TIGR01509 family) [Tamaricihabitans halophyticus]|uniref:HAD superfamily hydrolase (TIGR01509 family) n=1 Tax=Tamaricihabitans halophyticus TaxID=1262583 RepID=A0A4R2QMR2_9PSEU|nr:HAD family phosphatase [Tamaricihabitans halophyticus]TCP50863.1 HAD superfamily hydrolase (TIGR01509 family) [Tamaricihabitans halophyticus]